MPKQWIPLNETGAIHLLNKLSKFAATAMKLQLAEKLEQSKKTLAMIRRSHEIQNERHEQNTPRPAEKE